MNNSNPNTRVCKFEELPLGSYFKLLNPLPRFEGVVYRKTSLDAHWRAGNTKDNAKRLDTNTPAWFRFDQPIIPVDPPSVPTHQPSLLDELRLTKQEIAAQVDATVIAVSARKLAA